MKELLKKQWKYTLYVNEVGAYILTVICGTIGLYEVEHVLTNEQLLKYKNQGETFIDALANDISYTPKKYLK
ncbi:hypothetical protein [uncultured Kordia sp.]|uniref:hypothetical protein n=1 Tax=uncultured Kordia sp. TaxID=507699 RepID=UPI00261C76E4|nr:hypothetical protein [uncultured Kordia sp.]